MSKQASALIVGGTSGIGRAIAVALATRGENVVITGRNAERTQAIAREIGLGVTGLAVDLTRPHDIAAALAGLGQVDHLVLAAIERDQNTVRNYDVARALSLVTMKLVGYTEVVHTLLPRLTPATSIVLLGGQAKNRPYPGSVTVTTVNGGVESMVRALAVELAPIRVNALHPGVVSDTDAWRDKPQVLEPMRAGTLTGRLATTGDVAEATLFLLDNPAINGVNIDLEGGRLLK
jgi:NAD(P)-dependent dehydrogenase (short-subunit alcohol dehydrogenase family)